jgi:16S rRNA (guanine(1405)-N(7))-methyltransferase
MELDVIVSDVKKKKTLRSLDSSFVRQMVLGYFDKNPKVKRVLEAHPRFQKSRDYKVMLKHIRRTLHDVYGVFNLSKRSLAELEEHLKKSKGLDVKALSIHAKILQSHKSTQERFPSYEPLYISIFKVTDKPKTILDLACGLNPLSFPWMGLKSLIYYAYELSPDDASFIQSYFDVMKRYSGLKGKAFSADLLNFPSFQKCDVCFLFKALDSLESLKRGVSLELIKGIDAKFIVVSFPTRSISGKRRLKPRAWFLNMLKDLDLAYKDIELENEIFYVIKKQ